VTELQRKAFVQKAKSLQQTLLVELDDKNAVRRVGEELMASTNCGGDRFSPYALFSTLRGEIEAMTANTRQRAERYMRRMSRVNCKSSGAWLTRTISNGARRSSNTM
jgi:hypothetical protein